MNPFSVLDLSSNPSTLVLTAHYAFPPERVFAAWLDPQAMTQWIRPTPDCRIEVLEFDPTPGGTFVVRMTLDEGVFGYSGTFLEISAPHRLKMTWLWDPVGDDIYPETHLTVEFQPEGEGTRFTLTHAKMRTPESRDSHADGWTQSLTTLSQYLEQP